MEISNLFVCVMGMGVTFVGLTCIIILTTLMGKVLQKAESAKAAMAPAAAPAAVPAPVVSGDGITDEVKVAILAALAQQPGMDLSRAASVTIRRI